MIASTDPVDGAALRRELRALLEREAAPCVTITMPVERAWNRTRENQSRLRALVDGARGALKEGPAADGSLDAEALVEPAAGLVDDPAFWDADADGLLVCLAPGEATIRHLPFAPSELSVADVRLHVRPLWRRLEPDGRFYVLALSLGGAALLRASRYGAEAVDLGDAPLTLAEATKYDERTGTLRFHTGAPPAGGGRRAAIFHGQDDPGDAAVVKEEVLQFLRTLDNAVRGVLDQDATPPPLVLAGTDALRGLYRKVNKYRHVADEGVGGDLLVGGGTDPDGGPIWDDEALREKGWAAVRPHFEDERRRAADRFRAHPEQTAANEGSALLAAAEGRVDTLFVPEELQVWGAFDAEAHSVGVHAERQPGDTELLNAAAAFTLRAGGSVHVADGPEALPEDVRIAALLRY